eukprot:gnl/Chilomastix_cuspidata/366.p2 GENE.gnl/Chilomastix_cuspidata/366~~gnl/Chilomastix_cuspidata/366.p2  ORF type:complete len:946 (+),score=526.79 gnl/Chilomastix_cuspidata/366:48-2885(+)
METKTGNFLKLCWENVNTTLEKIPTIDPDRLDKSPLREIKRPQLVMDKEIIMTGLVVMARKPVNRAILAQTKLFEFLTEFALDEKKASAEFVTTYLRLVRVLATAPSPAEVLSEHLIHLWVEFLRGRFEATHTLVLGALGLVTRSREAVHALAQNEPFVDCVLEHFFNGESRVLELVIALLQDGAVLARLLSSEKIRRIVEMMEEESEENFFHFCFIFAQIASCDEGAELLDSFRIVNLMIRVLDTVPDLDCKLVAHRVIKLICHGVEGGSAAELSDEEVDILDAQLDSIELDLFTIESICSLMLNKATRRRLFEAGVASKAYCTAIGREETCGETLQLTRQMQVIAIADGCECEPPEDFLAFIRDDITSNFADPGAWFLLGYFSFFLDVRKLVPDLPDAILSGVESSRMTATAIYAVILALVAKQAENFEEITESIPSGFFVELAKALAQGEYVVPAAPEVLFDAYMIEQLETAQKTLHAVPPHVLILAASGAMLLQKHAGQFGVRCMEELGRIWVALFPGAWDDIFFRDLVLIFSNPKMAAAFAKADIPERLSQVIDARKERDTLLSAILVLQFVASTSKAKSQTLLVPRTAETLKQAAEMYADDLEMQRAILKSLWRLISEPRLKLFAAECGLLQTTLAAMARFADNEEIIANGLKTLWSFVIAPENRVRAVGLGAVPVVVGCAKTFSENPAIVKSAVTCIKIFANIEDDSCGEILLSSGAYELTVETLAHSTGGMTKPALQATYSLFCQPAVVPKAKDCFARVKHILIGILRTKKAPQDLVLHVFKLLRVFASLDATRSSVFNSDALRASVSFLSNNIGSNAAVVDALLRFWGKLAQVLKYASRLPQAEAHKALIRYAGKRVRRTPEIEEYMIKLLYAMSRTSAQNHRLLIDAGVNDVLVDFLSSMRNCEFEEIIKFIITPGFRAKTLAPVFPRTASRADF